MSLLIGKFSNFPVSNFTSIFFCQKKAYYLNTHLSPALQCVIFKMSGTHSTFSCLTWSAVTSVQTLLSVSGRILSMNPAHAVSVMLLYSDFLSASLNHAGVWSVERSCEYVWKRKWNLFQTSRGLHSKNKVLVIVSKFCSVSPQLLGRTSESCGWHLLLSFL